MTIVKRIVCLANSRKLSGRCIAGKEMVRGRVVGWARPVSARPHEEVSEYERQYENGGDPQVLDVIDVPLRAARPKGYQQENWLLDKKWYWVKVGRIRRDRLRRFTDHLAMSHWPDRVREKCKTDKSLAIVHNLEDLYVEPEKKRRKQATGTDA